MSISSVQSNISSKSVGFVLGLLVIFLLIAGYGLHTGHHWIAYGEGIAFLVMIAISMVYSFLVIKELIKSDQENKLSVIVLLVHAIALMTGMFGLKKPFGLQTANDYTIGYLIVLAPFLFLIIRDFISSHWHHEVNDKT